MPLNERICLQVGSQCSTNESEKPSILVEKCISPPEGNNRKHYLLAFREYIQIIYLLMFINSFHFQTLESNKCQALVLDADNTLITVRCSQTTWMTMPGSYRVRNNLESNTHWHTLTCTHARAHMPFPWIELLKFILWNDKGVCYYPDSFYEEEGNWVSCCRSSDPRSSALKK